MSVRNQSATLHGTAETHVWEFRGNHITLLNLKCCSIINQKEAFTYKAAKNISNNLKTCQNEYSIWDTQQFPDMLSNLPPLLNDEEDVSCDVESLFKDIPIKII